MQKIALSLGQVSKAKVRLSCLHLIYLAKIISVCLILETGKIEQEFEKLVINN